MNRHINRREFIKSSALTGAGLWGAGSRAMAESRSPNERLNVGILGVHDAAYFDTNPKTFGVVCIYDKRPCLPRPYGGDRYAPLRGFRSIGEGFDFLPGRPLIEALEQSSRLGAGVERAIWRTAYLPYFAVVHAHQGPGLARVVRSVNARACSRESATFNFNKVSNTSAL